MEIYPENMRKLFVDRERELEFLSKSANENIAIIGLRKTGKSMLVKEFIYRNKKTDFVYINLEEIISSPELLAIKFIGKTVFWVFRGEDEKEFLNFDTLLAKNFQIKSNALANALKKYASIMNSKKMDYFVLIKLVFDFAEELAVERKTKITLILDEFQEILSLKNYRGINNILGILRNYFENKANASYIILGSAVSLMENIVGKESPLFMLFREIRLENFDKNKSYLLVKKFIPNIPRNLSDMIYFYTAGNPFYIKNLCTELKGKKIDNTEIKKAFIFQTLSKNGEIYKYCDYIYKISLEKAKGYGNLKAVLQILTEKQFSTLTEISRKIGKPLTAIKDAMDSLIAVDILKEKEKKYFFSDPVLRYWIAYFELGIEVEDFPKEKDLISLINDLEEKYLQVSAELGKAKEFEFKDKLEKEFGLKLENYRKGKMEFDLVGKKNETWHVFEIKWKNSPADYKDLEKFYKNSKKVFKKCRLFFISKSGFTEESRKFAEKNDIKVRDSCA